MKLFASVSMAIGVDGTFRNSLSIRRFSYTILCQKILGVNFARNIYIYIYARIYGRKTCRER